MKPIFCAVGVLVLASCVSGLVPNLSPDGQSQQLSNSYDGDKSWGPPGGAGWGWVWAWSPPPPSTTEAPPDTTTEVITTTTEEVIISTTTEEMETTTLPTPGWTPGGGWHHGWHGHGSSCDSGLLEIVGWLIEHVVWVIRHKLLNAGIFIGLHDDHILSGLIDFILCLLREIERLGFRILPRLLHDIGRILGLNLDVSVLLNGVGAVVDGIIPVVPIHPPHGGPHIHPGGNLVDAHVGVHLSPLVDTHAHIVLDKGNLGSSPDLLGESNVVDANILPVAQGAANVVGNI